MIGFSLYYYSNGQGFLLFLIFGVMASFLAYRDLRFYKDIRLQKKKWLHRHLGMMSGALIASITAFIVAGLGYNNLLAWLLPSVVGTGYIYYQIRKINKA